MASQRQKAWLEEFLQCWNASEAARRTGYANAKVSGHRNKEKFSDEIAERLQDKRAASEQVLDKLSVTNLKRKSDHLYVFREEHGACKIGISVNVESRFRSLFTMMPYDLEIVFSAMVENASAVESELHSRFDRKRIKGEWFLLTDDDISYIKEMYGSDSKAASICLPLFAEFQRD